MKKSLLLLLLIFSSVSFAQEDGKVIEEKLKTIAESVANSTDREKAYKKVYIEILQDYLKLNYSYLDDKQIINFSSNIIKHLQTPKNFHLTDDQIDDLDKDVKVYKKSYLRTYLLKLYGFNGDFKVESLEKNTFKVTYIPTVYKKDTYFKEFTI
jgi:hypothetical protein